MFIRGNTVFIYLSIFYHYFTEFADCDSDITYFASLCHGHTRQWLFEDFDKLFSDTGYSRAYVLLGDAGVGKSVIAGALAQRKRDSEPRRVSPFLACGDLHARSRFARSTILEEKWGTTRSLSAYRYE